jgi:hypothetical protein
LLLVDIRQVARVLIMLRLQPALARSLIISRDHVNSAEKHQGNERFPNEIHIEKSLAEKLPG